MKQFVIAISLSLFLTLSGSVMAAPTWSFDDPEEIVAWEALNQMEYSVEDGIFKTQSTGADPYFFPGGGWDLADWDPFSGAEYPAIYMRLKVNMTNDWQIYYITEENDAWGEEQRQNFTVEAADGFTDVVFLMEAGGWQEHTVTHFRMDPGTIEGVIAEIDYMSLEGPLAPVERTGKLVTLWGALK